MAKRGTRQKMTTIKVGPAEPAQYIFAMAPMPKERPRFIQNGKKFFPHTPAKTRQYEDLISQATALQHPGQEPFTAYLTVHINFYVENHVHGDIDNLAKAILDGMQGAAFVNDKQIKGLHLEIYIDKNKPRTEVIILKRLDAIEAVDYDDLLSNEVPF